MNTKLNELYEAVEKIRRNDLGSSDDMCDLSTVAAMLHEEAIKEMLARLEKERYATN